MEKGNIGRFACARDQRAWCPIATAHESSMPVASVQIVAPVFPQVCAMETTRNWASVTPRPATRTAPTAAVAHYS